MRTFLLFLLLAQTTIAQERLYVVQTLDESLAKIDLTNGNVNTELLDLGAYPNDIMLSGDHLYVCNSASLQEISTITNSTIRDINVSGCSSLWSSVALNNDTLLVSCWASDNLIAVRISDGAVVGEITGANSPEGILVWEDRVFVCCANYEFPEYGQGYVLVFDSGTLSRVDSLAVGVNPQFAAVDSMGRLHIVCTGDYANMPGRVDVFDIATRYPVAILETGGTPATVSFGGGLAFLPSGGWGEQGLVLSYSISDLQVVRDVSNPILTAPGAADIDANFDGSFYVSCMAADKVEHRTANGTFIREFLLRDGPGYLVRVGANQHAPTQPRSITEDFGLIRAFPNPFNGLTRLEWSIPILSHRNILLFNISGQIVDVLRVRTGATYVTWDAGSSSLHPLSCGSYYAAWEPGGGAEPIQLIYLK